MIDSLDAPNARFLSELNSINRRLQNAQNRVASGKRITAPADDPDHVSALLAARAALATVSQSGDNVSRVKTEVNAAEKGLQAAGQALDRARALAAQGASDTQTADTRQTLAGEVEAVIEQIVGISRTAVEGRYIFSGDLDQVAPYTLDFALPSPLSAYAGSATSTRQIEHPNGSRFGIAKTANEIFDSADPNTNVLKSLMDLRNGLRANDTAAINAAQLKLSTAAPYLERMLAFYGTVQNKIDSAVDYGKKMELDLNKEISDLESADVAAAILEMQQLNTQQQAALQSRAQISKRSLFDYLS